MTGESNETQGGLSTADCQFSIWSAAVTHKASVHRLTLVNLTATGPLKTGNPRWSSVHPVDKQFLC